MLLNKQRKNQNANARRLLISINVLGSAGPIRRWLMKKSLWRRSLIPHLNLMLVKEGFLSLEPISALSLCIALTLDLMEIQEGSRCRKLKEKECTSATAQLTKGTSKEEKEGPQLQSLAAKALEKDYKQRAPDKLSQLTTALKSLTLSS